MRQIQPEEGKEPDADREQHEEIRQHVHLEDEFLFWALTRLPSRGRLT
jgi:hypothetical protein